MGGNKSSCWWQKHVIKKADKDSAVVVWDRDDYVKEVQKQLGDGNVYRKANYIEKLLPELVDKSNSFFKEFKREGCMLHKLWNILLMSIKNLLIWGNSTCFLKYTSV